MLSSKVLSTRCAARPAQLQCCRSPRQVSTHVFKETASVLFAADITCSEPAVDYSRREALAALALLGALGVASPVSAADPTGFVSCSRPLDGQLAAAFTRSVYNTVVDLKVVDEEQFQRENFKLRDREYKYYFEAHKDKLPRIPDLTDMTGGLSNPTYFNFVYYILWKIVAKYVTEPEARTAFCRAAAVDLLQRVCPAALDQARAAARAGPASQEGLVNAITTLLDQLQKSGYCCKYNIVWGELPGGWPADWMTSEPIVGGEVPSADLTAAGLAFQIKLHEPADIQGNVAMRSEADGFWSRSVSGMLRHLLATAGYPQATADEYFYQDSWSAPTSLLGKALLFFGDPLEQVDVPWTPTALVQNWQIAAK